MTQNYIASATQPLVNKLSRRYALSWLGAGGLATAFVVGSQTKTLADSKPKVIQAWVNAYNANDPNALAGLYTVNGVFEDVPVGFRIQGKNNIQCLLEGVFKIFANVRVEPINVFSDRNWALIEYYFSATNNGFIPEPSTIGKSFKVRAITVFELKGNKIQRSSDYYDNAAILQQLGLIPPLPAAPVPICSS